MRRNTGFSLVELVIVIVVLGLLAVAALPRFLDVTDKAKEASIEGVAGGFATAVLSARAQWEAEERPRFSNTNLNTNYVNYDGDFFRLTSSSVSGFRDGYPIAFAGGTQPPTGTAPQSVTVPSCIALFENLLQNPPKVGTTAQAIDDSYKYSVTASSTSCLYTQITGNATAGHYFEYDVTKGSVEVFLQ